MRWMAAPLGLKRLLRTSGQHRTAEGDGGANGTTPRTRPGGMRMPGAMATSLGTREDRSGSEQQPMPGDPKIKL